MCHSCLSNSPEYTPLLLRERPAWLEGSRRPGGVSGPRIIPAQAGTQASLHPPPCHSCASRNPGKKYWIPA